MSGISGAWRFARDCIGQYPPARVEALAHTLAHRGNTPSAQYQDASVLLVSNYFAVAPQDTANGLFADEAAGLVCALAGRIYNAAQLRQTLAAQGFACRTQTQEETVMRAYQLWGMDFAAHLDGQFGGVLWLAREHRMLLFRDRTGQRDLYYTVTPNGLFFGAELKALLPYLPTRPALNKTVFTAALMHQMLYEPMTAYENIYKLEKATVCWIAETGEIGTHCYWDAFEAYRAGLEQPLMDFEEAKRQVRQTIFDAVESMCLPGEEIGSFLSGGFDSTLIAGVLKKLSGRKIHTFSIGFRRAQFDESELFTLASEYLGTQHHVWSLHYRDLEPDWERILLNYDEPFCDASAFAEFACAKLASRHVRCALGGEGGDELFCGYRLNYDLQCTELGYRIPWASKKQMSTVRFAQIFLPEYYQGLCQNQLCELLKEPQMNNPLQALYTNWLYREPGPIAKRAGMGFFTGNHMSELMKVDRSCQLGGLESRRPLHTPRVIDLALRLPLDFCIRYGEQRYIYKQAFCDMLPDRIYYRKKMGFSIPIVEWLHDYRMDEVRRLFDRDLIEAQGIFHYEALSPYLDGFFTGAVDQRFRYFYGLQKWYNDLYLKL